MPPNTIAPNRPLPTGSASTHCVAGESYQSDCGRALDWANAGTPAAASAKLASRGRTNVIIEAGRGRGAASLLSHTASRKRVFAPMRVVLLGTCAVDRDSHIG